MTPEAPDINSAGDLLATVGATPPQLAGHQCDNDILGLLTKCGFLAVKSEVARARSTEAVEINKSRFGLLQVRRF
jgi:hypothetical protein